MNDIDWSKAPEWADRAIRLGIAKHSAWANSVKYQYVAFSNGAGPFCFDETGSDNFSMRDAELVSERPSPAWSGEGLPPVGVACEFSSIGHHFNPEYQWCIFHGLLSCGGYIVEFHHVTAPDRVTCDAFDPKTTKFRPIRTPEQIAASEREAAIRAIVYDLQDAENLSSLPSIASCLYGKGYRKQADK